MSTRRIRAVALDVDGTLAGADHRVSDRTVRVVRQVYTQGIVPILVTGRTERSARALSDRIGLTAPIISCNGAVVTDPGTGERWVCQVIAPTTVAQITDFATDHGLATILWTPAAMIADRRSAGTRLLELVNDETVIIEPLDPLRRRGVVKVMVSGTPSRLDTVRPFLAARAPTMRRGMSQFYETSTPGATKNDALRLVLFRLALEPEECLGIGDGDTDAEWLASIGWPVAVSNAMPAVRDAAVEHIGHHAEDAVADYLQKRFTLPG